MAKRRVVVTGVVVEQAGVVLFLAGVGAVGIQGGRAAGANGAIRPMTDVGRGNGVAIRVRLERCAAQVVGMGVAQYTSPPCGDDLSVDNE